MARQTADGTRHESAEMLSWLVTGSDLGARRNSKSGVRGFTTWPRVAVGFLFACSLQFSSGGNADSGGVADIAVSELSPASEVQEEIGLTNVSASICLTEDFAHCCYADTIAHPDCSGSVYNLSQCCPNADCWDDSVYTYSTCCGKHWGPGGNSACWTELYTYSHCCLADKREISMYRVLAEFMRRDYFYAMDDFYNDAQYGDDFGYYSKGHVLAQGNSEDDPHFTSKQQFAHFTTYPMVLSPHFGRVLCRLLFVMWIQLGERTPFRVVEMGAGSGQLSVDVQECVRGNELGIAPQVWRRWASSFEYIIVERSPALAKRQRERGLRVVVGDAQSTASCKPVLAAMAPSAACTGQPGDPTPECAAGDRSLADDSASVVLSNELLDAFSPVKLRLRLYGNPNVTSCHAYQEFSIIHTISENDYLSLLKKMGLSEEKQLGLVDGLANYTKTMFCTIINTTIGQMAMKLVPVNTSCFVLLLAHSMLRKEMKQGSSQESQNPRLHFRKLVNRLTSELGTSVAIPKKVYLQIRQLLKNSPTLESEFLRVVKTHQVPAALSSRRCAEMQWWFVAHEKRVKRLAVLFASYGFSELSLMVRPGERSFIDLVDCLLGTKGGFKLSIDYGAIFEALAYSLTVERKYHGIFVPPIPKKLMDGLPDCHESWPTCAGRIDWTTHVDFTNLAVAAESLGWSTVFYGAQGLLEHTSRLNLSVDGVKYSVPGYSVLERTGKWKFANAWSGHDDVEAVPEAEKWYGRWTGFKALLMEKPPVTSAGLSQTVARRPVLFPSWHLDSHMIDTCWGFDPTMGPFADWIQRNGAGGFDSVGGRHAIARVYAMTYEEAQLSVSMVDWLVATGGCDDLRATRVNQTLESHSLWQLLQSRLLRKWGGIWGAEVVRRVARDLLHSLADPKLANATSSPATCVGAQTYFALCEEPGGGSIMSLRDLGGA
eukprot:TRINITY_DN1459_c0_g1_i1.p1 TRINITY_DN1459_c0_g1~~TRINITY_DN1459_c0_g1_i1.p1  ORF type:complete len:941 (-),score=116.52 TRINITY_DN1459_c0_g1_i1:96-2918(-)